MLWFMLLSFREFEPLVLTQFVFRRGELMPLIGSLLGHGVYFIA